LRCVTVSELNRHGIFSIKPTDEFSLIIVIDNHLYRIEVSIFRKVQQIPLQKLDKMINQESSLQNVP
jgi:hypothetical protein